MLMLPAFYASSNLFEYCIAYLLCYDLSYKFFMSVKSSSELVLHLFLFHVHIFYLFILNSLCLVLCLTIKIIVVTITTHNNRIHVAVTLVEVFSILDSKSSKYL